MDRGTSQSVGVSSTRDGSVFSPSEADDRDARIASKVWDCEPVYVAIMKRSGTLLRAPLFLYGLAFRGGYLLACRVVTTDAMGLMV